MFTFRKIKIKESTALEEVSYCQDFELLKVKYKGTRLSYIYKDISMKELSGYCNMSEDFSVGKYNFDTVKATYKEYMNEEDFNWFEELVDGRQLDRERIREIAEKILTEMELEGSTGDLERSTRK